jgi:hypothetical protein
MHSLGVGAPVPTTQNQPGGAASHHETQRLKNRLVGSGAVRKRAEDAKLNGIDSKHRPSDTGSDEDESESRASAMKKGKTANGKPNGLSVFGSTKAQPAIQETRAIPPPSTPDRSSTSSPQPIAPSQEAMGIHTLPPKLSLAAKIWPRATPSSAPSPTGSDRPQTKRRKVAPMLPPPSPVPLGPDFGWNLQLPQLTPSRSPSTASMTSTVSSQAIGVDKPAGECAQLGSTAQLSRKERKRLRREAAQQSVGPESELGQSAPGDGADRDSAPEARTQDDRSSGAPRAGQTDSDGESKRVSRIHENGEWRKVHEVS